MRSPAEAVEDLRAQPCGALLLRAFGPGDGVHLVGGAVRDLLLGRPPRELDLVVEGELEAAIDRLGGDVTPYERFGTATVAVGDCVFDLARARSERYASPGALPVVAPADLATDLRRRDVTINALALGFDGTLRAVDGALEDLSDGVVRVLHDASFRDDATRLWRVARYAERLGFEIDPHTRELARAADPSTVSAERMGAELRLALREREPLAALATAAALQPALLPAGFDVAPPALGPALDLLRDDGRADLLTLAACAATVEREDLRVWLQDGAFTAAERDAVVVAAHWDRAGALREARWPSELARAARGAPPEAIALAGGDNARRWLRELRHVTLDIDGSDLLGAGVPEGPAIGAALGRALDARLDGLAPDRDAQLAVALQHVRARG